TKGHHSYFYCHLILLLIFRIQLLLYAEFLQNFGESRADLPEWIFHGLTALGTANMVQCNGETYLVRQQCKPHDCGNNFIISAYQPSSQKAWGMIVEVKDVPEAIDTPSKYARYIFIGKPDKAIQFLLMEQLKEDPNWK
ncbi:MAG: Ivy family c-type lysozyme inhibitor, partial [Bilophila wadsworthia]